MLPSPLTFSPLQSLWLKLASRLLISKRKCRVESGRTFPLPSFSLGEIPFKFRLLSWMQWCNIVLSTLHRWFKTEGGAYARSGKQSAICHCLGAWGGGNGILVLLSLSLVSAPSAIGIAVMVLPSSICFRCVRWFWNCFQDGVCFTTLIRVLFLSVPYNIHSCSLQLSSVLSLTLIRTLFCSYVFRFLLLPRPLPPNPNSTHSLPF